MTNGEIKMQRIRRENAAEFNILRQIVTPEVLHAAVPRLASVQEARVEHKNKMNEIQTLGQAMRSRGTGFDPTMKFQYVAQIDQAVWSAILEVFGKFDPETGEPMHDGLLYCTDDRGAVRINKVFFYTLIQLLESSGYKCDMRGKIKVN